MRVRLMPALPPAAGSGLQLTKPGGSRVAIDETPSSSHVAVSVGKLAVTPATHTHGTVPEEKTRCRWDGGRGKIVAIGQAVVIVAVRVCPSDLCMVYAHVTLSLR